MGTTACRLTRPNVGFSPTTPHVLAGLRIDPDVSPPIVAISIDAASAAAGPPLDPPALRERSHGLWQPGVVPPNENSGSFSLPTRTAPAVFMRSTIAASESGTNSSSTGDPAVVRMPRV